MRNEKIKSEMPLGTPTLTVGHSPQPSSGLAAMQIQEDERLLAVHGKTFHFAARFLPPQRRQAVTTLYAFFRVLDDLVDERSQDWDVRAVRLELDSWRSWFTQSCTVPPPRPALGHKIAQLITEYHLPTHLFLDFLDGLCSDLEFQSIQTFREMYVYCYRVAGTVGLAMAHLFGATSRQALLAAERLGVAMQLTNILRDVGTDLRAGRLYLPADELAQFGSSQQHLERLLQDGCRPDERFRSLMRYEIARARAYYNSGLPGIWSLPADSRLPLLMAGRLYRRILTVIERRDYDVLRQRASTRLFEKVQEAIIGFALIELWRRGEGGMLPELEVALDLYVEA